MSIKNVGVSKIEYQGVPTVFMTDMPVSPACSQCPFMNMTFKTNQLKCDRKRGQFSIAENNLEMYGRRLFRHPTPCGLTRSILTILGTKLESQPIDPSNGFLISTLDK